MFNLAEVNPQPTKVKIKIPKRLYMLFSIIILTSKGLVASDKARLTPLRNYYFI